jgi:hypothetical protein
MRTQDVNYALMFNVINYREVQNICGQINRRADRRRGLPLGRKLSQFFGREN